MATKNDLYSFKGEEPKPLPNEIRLSCGFTRTNISTFTEEEITDAGYIGPFPRPSYDLEKEYLEWDRRLMEWVIIPHPLPPNPTPAELLWRLRKDRYARLIESDWRVMPDSPLSAEEQEQWKVYRQKLRDLPAQFFTKIDDNNAIIKHLDSEEDYQNIVWPENP